MRTGLKATAKKIKEIDTEIQRKSMLLQNYNFKEMTEDEIDLLLKYSRHLLPMDSQNKSVLPKYANDFTDKEKIREDILHLEKPLRKQIVKYAKSIGSKEERLKKSELEDKLNEIVAKMESEIDEEKIYSLICPRLKEQILSTIEKTLESILNVDVYYYPDYLDYDFTSKKITFEDYYNNSEAVKDSLFTKNGNLKTDYKVIGRTSMYEKLMAEVFDGIYGKANYRLIRECHANAPKLDRICSRLNETFLSYSRSLTREDFDVLIENNEILRKKRDTYLKEQQNKEVMLTEIPENYIDFYPLARKMKRAFYIHVGPTNSGKTYDSIQRLKTAKNGIYLAPLRLLAFEQYENLNKMGISCSLLTGEESRVVDNAMVQSSTIEMANLSKVYDIAVIDEGQMIADENRGKAWTQAILGLCANEIHITTSPVALDIIRELISSCGDSCEVVTHERSTPLLFQDTSFKYPYDVQKGDALIVFSRKDVHAVANELNNKKKIKCSIIYGKLPYDVRQKEAQKFVAGETDVIVSTDAIGMGMNLPIKRIVFLSITKFNGKEMVDISREDVKQIAGRAGRLGIFEKGYVNTCQSRKYIRESLYTASPTIESIFLPFPESLIDIPNKLSVIFDTWRKISVRPPFKIQDISTMATLLRTIENETEDKHLLYKLVSIPFDEKNGFLYSVWSEFSRRHLRNEELTYDTYLSRIDLNSTDMEWLEHDSQLCDLLYNFARLFDNDHPEIKKKIEEKRNAISQKIMEILDKREYSMRRCKCCGRRLPWDYQYGYCKWCYNGYEDW